jgi:anti-anti-sigma regulatory factor
MAAGPIDKLELGLITSAVKRHAIAGRTRIILDLSEVTYISALLVAGLVICAETFRSGGGQLTLCGVSPALRNCIRTIDTAGKVALQPDIVAAIQSMSADANPSLPLGAGTENH